MAKADRNLSTLLRGLKALDLPPETIQALNSHLSRVSAAVGLSRVPGADFTRILATIDPAKIHPIAELLAQHPKLFASPLDVLARLDEARAETSTTDAVEDKRPALKRAVQGRLSKGERPGLTVSWKLFCNNVRSDCQKAWDTRDKPARGYGDKSIRRVVDGLSDKRDKR